MIGEIKTFYVNSIGEYKSRKTEYGSQYKGPDRIWRDIPTQMYTLHAGESVAIGGTSKTWGTTPYSCEYCGHDERSKYGACVGCGFTKEEA